jgi:hypothetical protein
MIGKCCIVQECHKDSQIKGWLVETFKKFKVISSQCRLLTMQASVETTFLGLILKAKDQKEGI